MKNLATCTPTEFMRQTSRIRKSVQKWLTDTDIINIRKRLPGLDSDATDEERKEALQEQARENFNAIMDAILDEHPDETVELLALLCFVEPKDADNHTMDEYFSALDDMLNSQSVVSFFTSAVSLVNRLG
jgi:hypothetical protein